MSAHLSSDTATAAGRTAREHGALFDALQALERALASPAPGREEAWKRRVHRDLASVVGHLQEHCVSAESPDGIVAELEVRLGRTYEVSQAHREHESLPRNAASLLGALDDFRRDAQLSQHEVREQADRLTSEILRHQAREADLLMLAFQQDIGVGD